MLGGHQCVEILQCSVDDGRRMADILLYDVRPHSGSRFLLFIARVRLHAQALFLR